MFPAAFRHHTIMKRRKSTIIDARPIPPPAPAIARWSAHRIAGPRLKQMDRAPGHMQPGSCALRRPARAAGPLARWAIRFLTVTTAGGSRRSDPAPLGRRDPASAVAKRIALRRDNRHCQCPGQGLKGLNKAWLTQRGTGVASSAITARHNGKKAAAKAVTTR